MLLLGIAVFFALVLVGCSPESTESLAGIFSELYEMTGSKAVTVNRSAWYYRYRYDFHPSAWAGSAVLDLGSPGFTLLDLSAPGLYAEPVTSISNAGKTVSVTARLGAHGAAGTGLLFMDPVENTLPGWDYNTVYPGIVDGMLFRQAGGLPDNSGPKVLATAYAWIAGLSACYSDALNYMSGHPDSDAIWRLTAVYDNYQIMPAGFLIEFQSMDGGLAFCKYVYNVQPGIAFDYDTARNWVEAAGDPMPPEDDGVAG